MGTRLSLAVPRYLQLVTFFSVRQFVPAFVAAIAGCIGRLVDEFRHIFENAASFLLVVVIDKGLPSDDLDPPLPPEILASDAVHLLKINEFEHDVTQQN